MQHGQGDAGYGLIVAYGYTVEAFFGWYSGNKFER
jgi:hypothetical protein